MTSYSHLEADEMRREQAAGDRAAHAIDGRHGNGSPCLLALAQVAAVEALIAPQSGLGYALVPGVRAFRERQIREALALNRVGPPAGDQPLPAGPEPDDRHRASEGRDLTGGDGDE